MAEPNESVGVGVPAEDEPAPPPPSLPPPELPLAIDHTAENGDDDTSSSDDSSSESSSDASDSESEDADDPTALREPPPPPPPPSYLEAVTMDSTSTSTTSSSSTSAPPKRELDIDQDTDDDTAATGTANKPKLAAPPGLESRMSVFASRTKKPLHNTVSYKESASQVHYFSSTGQSDIVEQILSEEKDPSQLVEAKSNDGRTPLHVASTQGNLNVMEVLFKYKADINAKMDDNLTPMMLAVLKDQPGSLRVLLARNCELMTQSITDGYSALHLGCMHQCNEAVTVLLSHIANESRKRGDDLIKTYVDLRSVKGYTALHFAVVEENMALVRLLTEEYRADVNARTYKHYTPLHFAAHIGNEAICKYLIQDRKALPIIHNVSNQTPYDLAVLENHEHLYALLEVKQYKHLDKECRRNEKAEKKAQRQRAKLQRTLSADVDGSKRAARHAEKAAKRKRKEERRNRKRGKAADADGTGEGDGEGETETVFIIETDREPTDNPLLRDLSMESPLIERLLEHPELIASVQDNPLQVFDQLPPETQRMLAMQFHENPELVEQLLGVAEDAVKRLLSDRPEALLDSVQNPVQLMWQNKNPFSLVRKMKKNPKMVLEPEFQEHPEVFAIREIRSNPKLRQMVVDRVRELNPNLVPLLPAMLGINPDDVEDGLVPMPATKGVKKTLLHNKVGKALTKKLVGSVIKKDNDAALADLEKTAHLMGVSSAALGIPEAQAAVAANSTTSTSTSTSTDVPPPIPSLDDLPPEEPVD